MKVEIRQELTLERQAFDAMMRINNGLDTLAIENVAVTVNFSDENGIPVLATSNPNDTNPAAKFFIRIDTMDGISDVTGTGSVAPGTSGEIHWLIIPIPGAAEGLPGGKLYYVGAHLSYTIGGVAEEVDVTPDFITVKPMPQLALDYFLTSEVIADDAFTPQIEPPEPFTLGVRIHNKGTGPANKVAIDSGQPKIVENEQGLLIGFTITGSTLDDQPASPDLKINFGDIASDSSKMGRWIMESSLSGRFTEFSATISHSDELGGAVTSLIDPNDVNTHFLLRDVRVDLPGRDMVRDFLAYPVNGSIDTLTVYESDTSDATVSNLSASATLTLNSDTGTDAYYTLALPAQAGPFYARIADPFNGTKVIKDVVRSDGKALSPDNAWNSKTRNRNTNPPSWEHWLNLFDVNGTGSYVVHIGEADLAQMPPVLQFIDDKVTAEGLQVGFMVVASDPNNDPVTLTATPLPTGAQFVDNGDGTAYFNWTPTVGQAGLYAINFKASDGSLNASRSVGIKVNPAWDTDGDGMDDAWEREHFGDLTQDGSADSDGDGVSDLDEYLNGTDPNLPPPAIPTGMLAFSGNGQSTLTWPTIDGATGYRIYWSEQSGVTKVNGTLLEATASPYTHTGLVNGTTYYYVMSSVGPGGESGVSIEFSVVPGNFDWGVPGLVEQTAGSVIEMDAAVAADGSALMVWSQSDGLHTNLWGARNLSGSGWDTPVLIDVSDTTDVSQPQLATDPDGYAMVLWRESDGLTAQLMVADYSPTIGWGTPTSLSSAVSIGDVRLLIRNDGSVVAVWAQGDTAGMNATVWSNSYVAGVWGSAQRIENGSAMNTTSLQLAADSAGNLLVVWAATSDGQFYDIVANTFDGASGWGTEQNLRSGLFGDATMPVVTPKLAMNGTGQAVLLWNEAASPNSIWANTYDTTAGWGTATLLDTSATLGAYMPVVAIDGTGNAVAAWVQSDGSTDALHTTRYTAGSGWDNAPSIQSVASRSSHPGNVSAPALAMDSEGNAVLAWQQGDGVETNIWARRYERSSASWLTPRIIETENAGDAVTPMVIMNTAGDTLVAWRQSDGQNDDLWANGFASGNGGMPNILPVVVVSDITADEQTGVTLGIDDAFDQDGTVVSYAWGQVSGSSVTLTAADSASATFTAPILTSPETLVFAVNVTDDQGGSTEKLLSVIVNPVNALPTANAGTDQSIDEQSTVSLIGTGSDSDGSIASAQWTQVSGTPVTLSAADTLNAGFTAPVLKTTEDLIFRLTVVDNEGGESFDDVMVTVNPVNTSPIVNAGTDQTVDEQTTVALSGSASDPDADGTIMSTVWTQVSGTTVTLVGADTLNAAFVALPLKQAETLIFRLTATDDEGGVTSADVSVTVNPVNHTPVVSAGSDQIVDEQVVVSLSGTASDPDADGTIVSTIWTQLSGTPVTLSNVNTLNAGFTAPTLKQAATLTFRLVATDDEGGVTSADVSVTVNPVNHPPVVSAGSDQTVDEQTAVGLSGTVNDLDADGTIVSTVWSQIAGTPVTLNNVNTLNAGFTAPTLKQAAVLVFRLTATDDEGGVTSADVNVTVNPVNHLPVVSAGSDQTVDEQAVVTLTGTATDPDADGVIASIIWTQLAGTPVALNNANSLNASFTSPPLKQAETLTFRLTATDDEGGVTSADVNVTVNPVNHPPVVTAGPEQTVDEQTAVTLVGTATDPDADGVIATTDWTQLSGTPVVLNSTNTLNVGFTAPTLKQAAILVFRLTATDDEGGVTSADVSVTVNPVNHAPVVNAGSDQTVDEQTAVNLSGTVSDPDADGTIVSTIWTQLSGTPVTLSNVNTLNADFTAPTLKQAATLTFRLVATDDEGGVTSADVSVTVNPVNHPPVVNAGLDQTVDEQTAVSLSGTASDPDADGVITTTDWSQIAGTPVTLNNANTLNAGFTAPTLKQAAVLVFRLTATDDEGGVTIDDVQVTVNPINHPPVVSAGPDQTVDEQTAVSLSGIASDPDADGVIASTVWSQLSGPSVILNNANTLNTGFTAPTLKQTAVVVFRLTATDDEGGVASADVSVTVNPVNHAPVVSAGPDQTVDEQTAVSLNGTASDPDADGTIVSTIWSQIAGTPVTLNNVNTLNAGFTAPTLKQVVTLIFRLTATDDEGGVTSADVSVTVNPVNHPPVVSAGSDQTVDEQTAVTLTGTATDPDADGTIVSTAWTQLSGTPVVLNNANTLNAGFTAPTLKQAATLVFRLTATDDEGGVTSADVSVTVNPVNHPPVVNAGLDQTVDEQTAVSLSGTASDPDADGVITTTDWSQIAGTPVTLNNANTLNADFTAPMLKQAAILVFRLTATDDEGGVAIDDVQVTVNPVNHLPVVDAGIDVSIAELTQHTLHAQASDPDADGVIASYQWSQIGGMAVTLNNANSADADFTAPAVYQDTPLTFQIDVVDDEGGTASDTIVVTVFSTNPDDDGDGMDDLWEIQYFGNLSHDGTADTDGDGATDLMEFEFGTDPLVPQGPGEPSIDTPDGTEVTSLQPQLVLSNGAHHPSFVVTYQFEVYSDPAMTQLVTRATAVSEGQGTTTWTVDQALQDNTWYYWRGRADGWVLFSSWVSSSFFVNTVNDPPGAFNVSSPQDGVWIDTFTPLLSVTNSSDVDGDILTYGFEVFRYGDTNGVTVAAVNGIAEGTNGTTEWLLDTPLSENEWYTWRSIVTDEHGAQTMSNEASIFVNTVNDAPTSPTPLTPADGSEITTLDTGLVTGNATDPDSTGLTYTFELDMVDTFDSSELQVVNNLPEGAGTTRWYVSGLRDNTWYYWRVKASDGMAESAWAVSRFFVNTANDAPTIPVHENPGDGAWVGTLSPTLSVYPSTDVDFDKLSYAFEIYSADRRKRIDQLVASGSSDTAFWQVTPALSESGWYYWRVQAIDEHGAESGWSDTVIFYADSDGINDVPVIRVKKLHNDEREHRDEKRSHRNAQCREADELRHNTRHDACERRKYTTIRWSDSDPDSNATIRLYVDTDNRGEDGTLIVDNIQEDPDGKRDSYRWDITDLAPGIYFIYAEIDDGTSHGVSYSPNALIVGDGGGHPYIELNAGERSDSHNSRTLTIQWDDLDADSNANIAFYYSDDDQGTNSVLIADGIAEDPDGRRDRYRWDMRSLAAGSYTLYAVISDEKEQLTVYAPYTVTLRQRGERYGHNDEHGRDKDEKDMWQLILQWIDEHL